MRFFLINEDGCKMAEVDATSYKKAYAHFKASFSGTYKIYWEQESKIIKLK